MGFEDDNYIVTPLMPLPSGLSRMPSLTFYPNDSKQPSIYRLVLEHGDLGVHSMSVTLNVNSQPVVTSIYDWESSNRKPPSCDKFSPRRETGTDPSWIACPRSPDVMKLLQNAIMAQLKNYIHATSSDIITNP